ncbi:MAG: serine/threonine-protein phosphatase [Rhodothermales bacterium]|nr:serine/threonine-protein phosphatase [Rhodothermales bacterium]
MTTSCEVLSGFATDKGLVRPANEDAVLHFVSNKNGNDDPTQVFVVADGMGGHRGGQTASTMAVEIARDVLSFNPLGDIAQSLLQSFRRINDEIVYVGKNDPTLHGMGTTLTLLAIRNCSAWIAHVGDSRAYRIRARRMEQLTQDDTLVARLAEQGVISVDEAANHPNRNLLVQAMGGQESVDVQMIGPIDIVDDDRFLLCTDGLLHVNEQTIANTIALNDPQTACGLLVRLANASGGTDNTTVQIVQCRNR